jgi:hypothetical protein
MMEIRNATKHLKREVHVCHVKIAKNKQARLSHLPGMEQRLGSSTNASTSASGPDSPNSPIDCFDMDLDAFDAPIDARDAPIDIQPPAVPNSALDEVDSEYPLFNLWDDMNGSRTLQFDRPFTDLFAELQSYLASGNIPFTTPLVPTNQEQELANDSVPDFGIEIPGESTI